MTDNPTTIPWTPSDERIDHLWSGDGQVDPIADSVPDMLKTLFAQQEALMHRVWDKEIASGLSVITSPSEWGQLDNRRIQGRIHETFGHIVRELSEAMAHLDGSKSWKLSPRAVNREAFREEVADVVHFFLELCILAGIDGESLFIEYFGKSRENFNRVENNY
jgi:NTP pyrophosphatase (non-canonical NTP hydrolase)